MTRLKCSFTGGEQNKVWSNLKDYVFPFLNKEAQEAALESISNHYNIPDTIIPENGEFLREGYSHILGVKHKQGDTVLEKMTLLKVLRLFVKADKKAYVIAWIGNPTGVLFTGLPKKFLIPTSKLCKPAHLKKPNGSAKAFDVEKQIAKNLGGEAAGASKTRPDFSCSLGVIKGESKLTVSKMGQGKVRQIDGKWEISSGSHEVSLKFKEIEVDNEPLTCYLDKAYPDGIIPKGFTVEPKSGTAAAYLQSTGANVLHVHDKKRLAGTSFVLDMVENSSDTFSCSISLPRITAQDIQTLDGSVCIEKTQNGDTTAIHRPSPKEMRKLAARGPVDLHNPDDAKEIMKELKGR